MNTVEKKRARPRGKVEVCVIYRDPRQAKTWNDNWRSSPQREKKQISSVQGT